MLLLRALSGALTNEIEFAKVENNNFGLFSHRATKRERYQEV